MFVIIDTENMPWRKLYDIDETGTEMAVRAVPVELIEQQSSVTPCENCDAWKEVSYLNGYGICQRTTTLEHKTHFCSAGQPGLTLEEGG